MKLTELKKSVDDAIERAIEMGEDPTKTPVTLQLEHPLDGSMWTDKGVELFYDGGAQCSGCVIQAFLPDEEIGKSQSAHRPDLPVSRGHGDDERKRSRNVIINRCSRDLNNIVNSHDPEIHHLGNRVWDRLEKMASEIETLSQQKIIQ